MPDFPLGNPFFHFWWLQLFFPHCLREVHIPGKMFKGGFKSWTCRDHWCYLQEHLRKLEGTSKSNSLENKLSKLLDWFRFLHPERRNKMWTKGPFSVKMCFGQMQVYEGWLYSFRSENFPQNLLFWDGDSWDSPEQPCLSHCWDTGLLILTSFLFQLNHTELQCYFLLQGTTLWTHRIRTCTNNFQTAVKPQLNCIKDQSKPKMFSKAKYSFQVGYQVLLWEHFYWSK